MSLRCFQLVPTGGVGRPEGDQPEAREHAGISAAHVTLNQCYHFQTHYLVHPSQEVRGDQKVTSQHPENTQEALSKYARDLTAAAAEGKLDPVSLLRLGQSCRLSKNTLKLTAAAESDLNAVRDAQNDSSCGRG